MPRRRNTAPTSIATVWIGARSSISEPRRVAVAAPVGAGDERVADAEDRLSDAEAVRLRVEHRLVPEPAKLLGLVPEAGLERDPAPAVDSEPRCVERRLRVVACPEPKDDLHVPLSLHVSAHDAEGAEQVAVLEQEPRDDRVERTLGRRELVRVAGLVG